MTNSSTDPWYEHFKEDGTPQSRLLLAVYGVRALWATAGILSNAAMVYVTWASKSLHGVCNVLIALESFFAIFQDASYYVSFFVFLGGVKFIPFRSCIPILILPSTCGNSAQLTMVLTGADRLLCVVAPIWYKTRNNFHYLLFVAVLLAIYGCYQLVIHVSDFMQSDQSTLLSCSTHELLRGGQLSIWPSISGAMLSGALMIFYVLVWVFAFLHKPTSNTVNAANKRLIKSLTVIIAMNLVGVFIKCLMTFTFSFWRVDVFVKTGYAIGMSFLTVAVYSANAPVLYAFSKEYRSKFDQHFGWLHCLFQHFMSTNVVTVGTTPAVAH